MISGAHYETLNVDLGLQSVEHSPNSSSKGVGDGGLLVVGSWLLGFCTETED